jgi:hypothetical protein
MDPLIVALTVRTPLSVAAPVRMSLSKAEAEFARKFKLPPPLPIVRLGALSEPVVLLLTAGPGVRLPPLSTNSVPIAPFAAKLPLTVVIVGELILAMISDAPLPTLVLPV